MGVTYLPYQPEADVQKRQARRPDYHVVFFHFSPIKPMISKLARLFSTIKWHDFRSVQPLSRQFGMDRGTPIDRYYIEQYLDSQRAYVKGRALEIADAHYIQKYDSGVTHFEILHYTNENPKATIIGDLTHPETLPENYVDCFVCTQTLNLIYEVHNAVKGIHHILKPGGTALVTIPSITQISRYDADRWGDHWRFTPQSAMKLFGDVFGKDNVEVKAFGNCLSSIALLKGMALEELTTAELEHNDPDYPMIIGLRAVKK